MDFLLVFFLKCMIIIGKYLKKFLCSVVLLMKTKTTRRANETLKWATSSLVSIV